MAVFSELTRTARPTRTHDCVLLFSGGKDSTFALLELLRTYKLKVLALTLDNGFLSPQCEANICCLVRSTGVDHVMVRPQPRQMQHLYRIGVSASFGNDTLKYSTNACGLCISTVLGAGINAAVSRGIPFLAGGWTPGQFTDSAVVPGEFLRGVIAHHVRGVAAIDESLSSWLDGVSGDVSSTDSLPPLINPLACKSYDDRAILDELTLLGWVPPPDTDSCSTNCRLNGYLVIHHIAKYGYHPYVYELSWHVRHGLTSREGALDKMTHLKVRLAEARSLALELRVAMPPVIANEEPLALDIGAV